MRREKILYENIRVGDIIRIVPYFACRGDYCLIVNINETETECIISSNFKSAVRVLNTFKNETYYTRKRSSGYLINNCLLEKCFYKPKIFKKKKVKKNDK